jgi:uncharacterized protein (UPF0303 family)
LGDIDDIQRLKAQEELLQFTSFTEADAWALGAMMRSLAVERSLPIVIDIRSAGRKLFYAAMPGTTPDNEHWVRRKINTVMRFHQSSYLVGREFEAKGAVLNEARGISPTDHAPHGGCFPIRVRGVGVIGAITVSGLPQREDHDFVVECVCAHLDVAYGKIALTQD